MSTELVQLVVEIDVAKATAASKRMRDEFGAAVRDMDGASKRAEGAVAGVGTGAQGASKLAAAAMRAMSAGIGAATAAAAAQQRSWLSLGTTILTTFAAGGPVAGAIAALGAGIGLLTGEEERAKRAAEEAADATRRWLADSAEKAREAREEIERLNDETRFNRDLAAGATPVPLSVVAGQRGVEDARQAAEEAAAAFRDKFPGLGLGQRSLMDVIGMVRGGVTADGRMMDLLGGDAIGQRLVSAVHALDDAERKLAATRSNEASKAAVELTSAESSRLDRADRANAALRDEIELLRARTDAERDALTLIARRRSEVAGGADPALADAVMRERWRSLVRSGAEGSAAAAAKDAADWWNRVGRLVEEADEAELRLVESSRDYIDGLRHQSDLLAATSDDERDRLEIERQIEEALRSGTLAVEDAEEAYGRLTANAKQRRAIAQAEAEQRKAERLAEVRDRSTESVARQLRYLQAASDVDREILEIEDRIADLRKDGVPEGMLADLRSRLIARTTAAASGAGEIQDFARSLADTVRGGLTDAVVNGLQNGFENGWDVVRSFVDQLQRQLVGSLVGGLTSGLPSLIAGLFGGGGGGGGIGSIAGPALSLIGGGTSGPGFSPLPPVDDGFT